MQTSVYVHFPWCLKKCPYCDFASTARARDTLPHEEYADAVVRELAARDLSGRRLESVFFGGGTPSLWAPDALGRALAAIRAAFEGEAPDLEVTVECNPTSLDREKARALAAVGVNRLSIGVQSTDDARLGFLGRLHDGAGALAAVEAAQTEVARVSADLMFGMPGQDAEAFARELDLVLATGVSHVSAYALTVEPETQFGALHKKGKLPLASEHDFATTFVDAERVLGERGLAHYEVSNYARPGEEARHNQHTWRGGDYLGLGAGAVGALSTGTRARRTKNDPRAERYLAQPADAVVFEEALSPEDRVREALMLGLRTSEGVDLAALQDRTGLAPLEGREAAVARRQARGDVVLEGARLRIPPARWLHLDAIVGDLF